MQKEILSNKEISSGIYKMVFKWKGQALPGQFIMVNCKGSTLLKRPISICTVYGETMSIVYKVKGEGTNNLSKMKPGDFLDIHGPHGHGFDIFDDKKNVLIVGGGIGIPPLLYLAQKIKDCNVYIAIGFKNEYYLVNEFEKYGKVIVTTEDGSYGEKGYVTEVIKDLIGNVDIIYGCGPKPMLKVLKDISLKNDIPCQISVEERMGCGIGACLVCACRIKDNGENHYKKVCKDGPVFWAKEVEF